MSHITGTIQFVNPVLVIGPDSGLPATSLNTWAIDFAHTPAPTGTQLLILHFTGAAFPPGSKLEVDLGYGAGEKDVFTSADGSDFWTRPINPYGLTAGKVAIRYISGGAATGGVQLDVYGRGERHTQDPTNVSPLLNSYSNSDPFLDPAQADYLEPDYAKLWVCSGTPNWENVDCIKPPGDIRNTVAPAVGMIVHADYNKVLGGAVSTCTVTLVAPDIVVTAGHCMQDPIEDAASASIIFGYQLQCNGKRPTGYKPAVHKVKEVIAQKFADGTGRDYCLLRLQTPVVGVTPVPMRNDFPAVSEQVFGIHHPNGAPKKLSVPHPTYATVISSVPTAISVNLDVAGGSSGSGLFDMSGRIIGICSGGGACSVVYFPIANMQQDLANPTPITRDVMLVLDRSGSMADVGTSGDFKFNEAAKAASLFVQLVRASTGNRVGMVSFATSASSPVDFALADVTPANKDILVGPSPYNTGLISALIPTGGTSIGGGLNAAYAQLSGPGSNPRNILLLTDGMQNAPPLADPLDGTPKGIVIHAIGFGTPGELDGAFLTALANNHLSNNNQHGHYVLADTNLKLQKFFALAFGNIFEAGLLMDPEFILAAGQLTSAPMNFKVCEEEAITLVAGWDHRDTPMQIVLKTPSGAVLTSASPGVESRSAPTWTFLRVPLPHAGERNGEWSAIVARPIENLARSQEARYFINVIASGGAKLRRMPDPRTYYTGDSINPLVGLQYLSGGVPPAAKVRVNVTRPKAGVGSLLSKHGLGAAEVLAGDVLPARQSTLRAIQKAKGQPVVEFGALDFDLASDVLSSGSPEPAGVFGRMLSDLLTVDGHYTFHYFASYGEGCTTTRELLHSMDVRVGIDPDRSDLHLGRREGQPVIVLHPRDRFGNEVGPGAADQFEVTGIPGTKITGPVLDNGDGSYSVPVAVDDALGERPGLSLGQPGRAPIVVVDNGGQDSGGKGGCGTIVLILGVIIFALALLLMWAVFG